MIRTWIGLLALVGSSRTTFLVGFSKNGSTTGGSRPQRGVAAPVIDSSYRFQFPNVPGCTLIVFLRDLASLWRCPHQAKDSFDSIKQMDRKFASCSTQNFTEFHLPTIAFGIWRFSRPLPSFTEFRQLTARLPQFRPNLPRVTQFYLVLPSFT